MKFDEQVVNDMRKYVAPLVGAWIEITVKMNVGFEILVAPLVGAWIEILACSTPKLQS